MAEGHLQRLKTVIKEAITVTNTKAVRDIQLHAYILEVEILGRLKRFDEIQQALEASHFCYRSFSRTLIATMFARICKTKRFRCKSARLSQISA